MSKKNTDFTAKAIADVTASGALDSSAEKLSTAQVVEQVYQKKLQIEGEHLDREISYAFSDLKMYVHKIRAAALAAGDAIDSGSDRDPVSLIDIVTEYAERLEMQLEATDLQLRSMTAKLCQDDAPIETK